MADLSQYDPNDIRNIVNEILSKLRAMEQGFIEANTLEEIAGELGDVPISITDDDGNLVFLISQVNLFEEYGVDTYVSFFAADGTPTVWVDPVTGLLTDASGTVVSGDVISDSVSSTVGNLVVMSNTDGKHVQELDLRVVGDGNVGFGIGVLNSNVSGGNIVAIGTGAGYSNTDGDENVLIGNGAGYSNINGNKIIAIGKAAGYWETGSDKLFIGNDSSSVDEATGRQATLIYGDTNAGELTINGDLIVTGSITGSSSGLTHPQIMARVSLGF